MGIKMVKVFNLDR